MFDPSPAERQLEGKDSVVVVTWNSCNELPALAASLDFLDPRPEIIIVDNASTDGSAALARRLLPEARVITLEDNRGYGAGCNEGVRVATGEVVMVLNPDTVLIDTSLSNLFALAREERAILGPRLLNPDGTPQISAWQPVASWELLALVAWPGSLMPALIRRRCEPWRFDERLDVGWLSGACIVARTELLRALGPFDERLHMYSEDIDLCLRAQSLGIRTIFAPSDASIVHMGGRSSGQRFSDRGTRLKIATRTWVVRRNRGTIAAVFDWCAQLGINLGRLLIKTALREDTLFERTYLRCAVWRGKGARHS